MAGSPSVVQRIVILPAIDLLRNPLLHPTLRFREPAAEARYFESQASADLRRARIALVAAFVANILFAFVDAWSLPAEALSKAFEIRSAVIAPGVVIAFALTFTRFYRPYRYVILGFMMLCFTASYAAAVIAASASEMYVGGFAFVVLAIYSFLPFNFVSGTITAWLAALIFFALLGLNSALPANALFVLAGELLTANVIGMTALFRTERFARLAHLRLDEVMAERGNYHSLLLRILPRSVADRLTGGEPSVVEFVADSTVLFADIVGFTEIAARYPPAESLEFLNVVFGTVDKLVERYQIEKIKTIGDAYMAAGGLNGSSGDHTERVCELALDMVATIGGLRTPDGATVRVRIGIHAGPLVAGVIGDSRFHYDLWGDTVNIASRMETLSEPGRVQVSDEIYRRLAGRFLFEPRGTAEVKGIGQMRTWFLIGRRPDAPVAVSEKTPADFGGA